MFKPFTLTLLIFLIYKLRTYSTHSIYKSGVKITDNTYLNLIVLQSALFHTPQIKAFTNYLKDKPKTR